MLESGLRLGSRAPVKLKHSQVAVALHRGHVLRAEARRELDTLLRKKGALEPQVVNAFLHKYGKVLHLGDTKLRAVLRKAGLTVKQVWREYPGALGRIPGAKPKRIKAQEWALASGPPK